MYKTREVLKERLKLLFWFMISLWICSVFLDVTTNSAFTIVFSVMWIFVTVSTLKNSIKAMKKLEDKTFPMIALLLSAGLTVLFVIGFFIGFLGGI
jgi:hypothetical protein